MQRVQTIKILTGVNICLGTLKVSKKVAGVEYAIRDIVLAARKVEQTGMNIDYGAEGFTTFQGTNGMPTEATVRLEFTELETLTNKRSKLGY